VCALTALEVVRLPLHWLRFQRNGKFLEFMEWSL